MKGASPARYVHGEGVAIGSKEYFENVLRKRSSYEIPWLFEVFPFQRNRETGAGKMAGQVRAGSRMVCGHACALAMITRQTSRRALCGAQLIPENIYGHSKRLEWIVANLEKDTDVIELGCGTGSMISIPLAVQGYQIIGIDTDDRSIAFGRELLRARGLSSSVLQQKDIREISMRPNVLIASEVLEHLHDDQLQRVLHAINDKLGNGEYYSSPCRTAMVGLNSKVSSGSGRDWASCSSALVLLPL